MTYILRTGKQRAFVPFKHYPLCKCSGQIIPLSSILGNDGLTVLSYFSPYRYTNALQYESFVQPNSSYGDFVYNGSQSVFTYSKNG